MVDTMRIYCGIDYQPIVDGTISNPRTSLLAGSLAPGVSGSGSAALLSNTDYEDHEASFTPSGMNTALNMLGKPGDWDTGPSVFPDGPYLNPTEQSSPDSMEGYWYWYNGNGFPYFIWSELSPNKRIASAVKFGSLPTGSLCRAAAALADPFVLPQSRGQNDKRFSDGKFR